MNLKKIQDRTTRMDLYAERMRRRQQQKHAPAASEEAKSAGLPLTPLPLDVLREANYLPTDHEKDK